MNSEDHLGDPKSQLTLALEARRPLERISRRARRIRIEIRGDGEVVLIIPRRASRAAAYRFLDSQTAWIARERQRLRSRPRAPVPELRWDGADLFPLRGLRLPLRVEVIQGRRAKAEATGQGISLCVPASWRVKEKKLRGLLLEALKFEAKRDALTLLSEESERIGLNYSELRLRDMRSRWGSCGPDGRISLSVRLVMAPPEVFRYVVIHELCHIRWRSHGPRFWAMVRVQMPEFEMHRGWLRRHGDELLAWPLR